MEKPEWSLDELKHKAENYCVNTERCCSEVKNKLLQWGANENYIEDILIHLQQHKYIDEARYCRAFAHDKVNYQGWGKLKIKAALQTKHLSALFIKDALESIDEIEYNQALDKIIASKKRTLKNDPLTCEKLIRFCMQRGFTYNEISTKL